MYGPVGTKSEWVPLQESEEEKNQLQDEQFVDKL